MTTVPNDNILSQLYGEFDRPDYTPGEFANWFIVKASIDKKKLTHLKLQKLLYFSYGIYLSQYKKILFDETFKAWPYGPVVNSAYAHFKRFGLEPIALMYSNFMSELISNDNSEMQYKEFIFAHTKVEGEKNFYPKPKLSEKEEKVHKIINLVWEKCKKFEAFDLSMKTHKKTLVNEKEINPWVISWDFGRENNQRQVIMPPSNIYNYFSKVKFEDMLV